MGRKLFVIAVLIISFSVCGCSKKEKVSEVKESEKKVSQEGSQIKQEVYTLKVEGFNKDRKIQWGLEGESAQVGLEKINISDLKAIYYGDDMTFTLFADKGVYNKKTQHIELKKNIIGRTSDGSELITDYAEWNAGTEEITTDSCVIVKRQNITCKGKGLITKPRLKYVSFRKEVEVTIEPDKKITCDGPFELDHEKNIAFFNNNVKITDKDSETFTDRLTVYLDPHTNKVVKLVTEGNVKVVHRGSVEDMGKISF